MSTSRRFGIAGFALMAMPLLAIACLWDSDTLQQERSRFPSALELITGKFLRHSPEFYQWRIDDRLKKLQGDPNHLPWLDDLAVAYSKVGQYDKAVETILRKEKIKPGLYETYSNLGTFHVLAGEFEKGLPYIDKALAVNPDAHFGREKYQKILVEYVLAKKKEGKFKFPMRTESYGSVSVAANFNEFLCNGLDKHSNANEEQKNAVQGVLGMMRFANHSNPLLLEALGDLLCAPQRSYLGRAKTIAARAYLQASYQVKEPDQINAYRKLATDSLEMKVLAPNDYTKVSLQNVEKEYRAELAEAETWYADLRNRELQWIKDGLDVELEFDKLYKSEPDLKESPDNRPFRSRYGKNGIIIVCAIALVLLYTVLRISSHVRRRLKSDKAKP